MFKYTKEIIGKRLAKAGRPATQAARIDDDLPLGIRLGTIIDIPSYAIAMLDGSLLRDPQAQQAQVVSISRLKLKGTPGLEIFRFYTDAGENRLGIGKTFLQLSVHNKAILDAGFYQFLVRQHPSADEIEAYLGKGYGLGEKEFFVEGDILTAAGFNREQIDAFLGGEEALVYRRDTPIDSDYVTPYAATETRIDSSSGEDGLKQTVSFMPYVRELNHGYSETLLISFEHITSFDGQPNGGTHVDFMVGTTINPQRLTVY